MRRRPMRSSTRRAVPCSMHAGCMHGMHATACSLAPCRALPCSAVHRTVPSEVLRLWAFKVCPVFPSSSPYLPCAPSWRTQSPGASARPRAPGPSACSTARPRTSTCRLRGAEREGGRGRGGGEIWVWLEWRGVAGAVKGRRRKKGTPRRPPLASTAKDCRPPAAAQNGPAPPPPPTHWRQAATQAMGVRSKAS